MTESPPIEAPRIYPTLRARDPEALMRFLSAAFGVRTYYVARHGGEVVHAELSFGSAMLMLGRQDDGPFCRLAGAAGAPGHSALYLAVENPDALFARAVAAGAAIREGLTDRPYGSREFVAADPEGNLWCFGTWYPKAHEVPPAEG